MGLRGKTLLPQSQQIEARVAETAFLANPPPLGVGKAPAAGDLRVLHLQQARFPHLRFEYHPVARRCYVIRLDVPKGEKPIAEPIAWEVPNEGTAWNVMLMWLRGYQHARAEKTLSPAEQEERSGYVNLA